MDRRQFVLSSSAALSAAYIHQATAASGALPARLAPAHDVLAKQIAEKRIPGGVFLVARGDDVTVDAVGMSAIDGTTPMRRETIFRIASMTKAVTATAVMMLVEEKKIALDAPVERWLPELANPRVLRKLDGAITDVEPARRAITVHDLLAFTLGSGMVFAPNLPIQSAANDQKLVLAEPLPMTPHAPDEWMKRFGALPLIYQPGTHWLYNVGSLLQGVLVRRVSGQSFDAFVSERILAPLGMTDTGFSVPASKLDRYAGCGVYTNESGKQTRMDADGAKSAYASRPTFPSGAAGLVSTVDDYLAFARMLLKGGMHGSKRLLSEATVRKMTTNQLTREQVAASASSFFPHFFDTHSWGYGMSIVTATDPSKHPPGTYGWMGGFGSAWYTDPAGKLITIVMTQSSDFLFNGAADAFFGAVNTAEQ